MQKTFFVIGAVLAFIAVGAGAFGTHGLKHKLSAEMLDIFEVGVKYQMYHALAIILVALSFNLFANAMMAWSGWIFLGGTILFSGSLYILALTGIKAWGAVTPIGGLLFLIGWALYAISIIKS